LGCSRTPGPLGINDQGDPDALTLFGDTPGPLGSHLDLGFCVDSLEELRSIIVSSPSFDTIVKTVLLLGGDLPPELMEGDFV